MAYIGKRKGLFDADVDGLILGLLILVVEYFWWPTVRIDVTTRRDIEVCYHHLYYHYVDELGNTTSPYFDF